jgi:hypothetical protein
MKIHPFEVPNPLAILSGCFLLMILIACNTKSEKSGTTVFEEKPSTTVVKPETADTIAKSAPNSSALTNAGAASNVESTSKEEETTQEEVKPIVKPTPKICSPSFSLIGKPKSNRYIYYVTGFKANEFKCWAEIETHGQSICKGEPCVIYYIDSPKAPLNATPPHYVDPNILKEHGIGQFEHTNHWWEVKGAKQLWGRPGKEFVYYNTNNNAGG